MILGRIKFYLDRLQNYGSKVQFLMVAWLFFQTVEWSWWWGLGAVLGGVFVVWFDAKYVLPGELNEFMRKNPAWVKFMGEGKMKGEFVSDMDAERWEK